MEKLLTDIEQKELNKFGRLELTASHTYLHLANRMKTAGYFGAEKLFTEESLGERDHEKIYSHHSWFRIVDYGLL